MDDRYIRSGTMHEYNQDRSPGARDYSDDYDAPRSSARYYEAEGRLGGGERNRDRGNRYGGGGRDYGGSYWSDGHRSGDYGGRDDAHGYRGRQEERGFLDRAGDEVRSWFGDEEAERRREMDARRMREQDGHYQNWRAGRIAELDRDYDEYRRENAQKFENEFGSWRTERQGQRDSLGRVTEHMEVVGSDGEHLGTVDKVRGDRILLTKSDPDAGGHHHSIPSRWIRSVDDKVTLAKTADEARSQWKDEERSGAMFGEDRDADAKGPHMLGRSFSGTY